MVVYVHRWEELIKMNNIKIYRYDSAMSVALSIDMTDFEYIHLFDCFTFWFIFKIHIS